MQQKFYRQTTFSPPQNRLPPIKILDGAPPSQTKGRVISSMFIACKRPSPYLGWNLPRRILLNLVEWVVVGYTHCEIAFKFVGDDRFHSYSAESFKTLGYYEDSDYEDGTWSIFKIASTLEERKTIYTWCRHQIGKPMNYRGLFFNFIPGLRCLGGDGGGRAYFCSEFVMCALKEGMKGKFDDVIPHFCSPQMVKSIMESHPYMCSAASASPSAKLANLSLSVIG